MKNAELTGKQRRRRRLTLDERVAVERQGLRDDLGQRLRAAREQKKIGLRELARRLGMSASLISQIETGKTEPSINTLFAIVSELELSVNEIVFDSRQDAGGHHREPLPLRLRMARLSAAEPGSLARPTQSTPPSSAARTEHRSASSPGSAGNGSPRSLITTSTSSTSAIRRGASRLLQIP